MDRSSAASQRRMQPFFVSRKSVTDPADMDPPKTGIGQAVCFTQKTAPPQL